jgi:hypothetical protein
MRRGWYDPCAVYQAKSQTAGHTPRGAVSNHVTISHTLVGNSLDLVWYTSVSGVKGMADHHDAQDYTANGPTSIGFRTGGDNTGIANGVVATGTEIGVHGIGAGVDGSSAPTFGVVGESSSGIGVKGKAVNHSGVVGESATSRGVHGVGGFIGVHGEAQNGTGVFGDSNPGAGVRGRSKTGVGGQFESEEGVGLSGSSSEDRGGVFSSGPTVAQIRLVSLQQNTPLPMLPARGKVGDLIVIRNTAEIVDEGGNTINIDKSTLWLCTPSDPATEDSDQWQSIVLGTVVTGTL